MLRSLGVIVFITIVGATGIYFANRPTVARGDVMAADLMKSSNQVKSIDCDKQIPIGHGGATFSCQVELKDGRTGGLKFVMDRAGSIKSVEETTIKKSGDPWAD